MFDCFLMQVSVYILNYYYCSLGLSSHWELCLSWNAWGLATFNFHEFYLDFEEYWKLIWIFPATSTYVNKKTTCNKLKIMPLLINWSAIFITFPFFLFYFPRSFLQKIFMFFKAFWKMMCNVRFFSIKLLCEDLSNGSICVTRSLISQMTKLFLKIIGKCPVICVLLKTSASFWFKQACFFLLFLRILIIIQRHGQFQLHYSLHHNKQQKIKRRGMMKLWLSKYCIVRIYTAVIQTATNMISPGINFSIVHLYLFQQKPNIIGSLQLVLLFF